ncbi:transposase [Niabella drilacis]|uniref:REP element-mobilizing transposase RayT n=1 Tax=Niabella drilacis (strain DSM 25811 / CCM 8410 / CCUG 62505 / LMG 26954 / E90) TaxID=1285928 RepID=A0A1G6SL44_NIADE|nr:transposase [Niabella drilacis]SDD17599.1 REP element-mobilizing transposase RayT [Niabella drilacis]
MDNRDIYQPLSPGVYYHIYNRGNNKENIFREPDNFAYFLLLWERYLARDIDLFCYCLLPNHFHFLVRIKEFSPAGNKLAKKFSNMFNAYAKAFNKKYGRTGSLFQKRFRRKKITDHSYYTTIIGYILTNPVRHHLSVTSGSYPYSAYNSLLSEEPTLLLRNELLDWFGSREALIRYIRNYEKAHFPGDNTC